MKQSPSQANRTLIIVTIFALLPTGCSKRASPPRLQTTTAEAPAVDVRRININRASVDELEKLPGIGRTLAERIVAHRLQHGPFRRIEHVMMVRGISERKFLDIRQVITVH